MHIEHIELRKNLRISINMDISYSTANAVGSDATEKKGTLIDLSGNGAGLMLDEPLSLNQTLRLEGYGDWDHPRDAKVRWVRKANAHYRVGVEFLSDEP
ncbi:MAG: PilZ domain-containing protein [Gammaproteobacteria bacterium]|nr:PilZ domain-containing protein [Gammaproteobacteria bacterium]